MGRAAKNYPRELKDRAVALVREVRPDYPSEYAAIESVARKLGIGTPETLRKWIRQAEIDSGARHGVTSEESAEVRRLRSENRELRRANEILKAASVFFAAELDRPLR
ncbi:MAG: transposase [Streptosporangiaceae bacterium]